MYCASCTFDREYLLYVCTGDVYGEEAIAKYSADPESMRFDCCYIGGVAKMTIEGNVISGVDAEGNEIFRHAYAPVEVENNENGFIFYKTEDETPVSSPILLSAAIPWLKPSIWSSAMPKI